MKKYTPILFMLCIIYSIYTVSADSIQPKKCAKLIEIESLTVINDLQQKKHALKATMLNSAASKTPTGIAP